MNRELTGDEESGGRGDRKEQRADVLRLTNRIRVQRGPPELLARATGAMKDL